MFYVPWDSWKNKSELHQSDYFLNKFYTFLKTKKWCIFGTNMWYFPVITLSQQQIGPLNQYCALFLVNIGFLWNSAVTAVLKDFLSSPSKTLSYIIMTTAVDNLDEQNKNLVLKNVFGSRGTVPLQKCNSPSYEQTVIKFHFGLFNHFSLSCFFNTNSSIKCTFMYRKDKTIHMNSKLTDQKSDTYHTKGQCAGYLNGDWVTKVWALTGWFNSEHSSYI